MIPFVDANVIVKAFTENVDREKCRKILSKEFLTNTLCLVEAMKIISLIIHDKVEAAACIKSVYKSNCIIIDLDKNLLFEAIKRADKYHLSVFDLINHTTALLNSCTEIISYDKDFNGLEIKRTEP